MVVAFVRNSTTVVQVAQVSCPVVERERESGGELFIIHSIRLTIHRLFFFQSRFFSYPKRKYGELKREIYEKKETFRDTFFVNTTMSLTTQQQQPTNQPTTTNQPSL